MKEIVLKTGASLQHALDFLQENNLPFQDIDITRSTIISFEEDNGSFVGIGGLEFYGPYALIRSVAVRKPLRGKMFGHNIVASLIERARQRSAHRIFLLTETAHDYFLHLGFRDITRDEVPPEIKTSTEFSNVCPVSAACMVYETNDVQSAKPVLTRRLNTIITELMSAFVQISAARKTQLQTLAEYVTSKLRQNHTVDLNFICTHNSRRSHIAQVWAQTAAYYYEVNNVRCFSGGTETTALNPRAIIALEQVGFEISKVVDGENPVYEIGFSPEQSSIRAFSKKYNDAANPVSNFAAVMTCSDADENCPFIPGAEKRIPLTYDDPKEFDGTEVERQKYSERTREIGRDLLFCFNEIRKMQTHN